MVLLKIVVQVWFALLPVFAIYVAFRKPRRRLLHRRSVAVVVLGDIGRSPRMMYHSQSFAQHQFETFIIGYSGSEPSKSLASLPHVHFVHLPKPPSILTRAPKILFPLVGPLKVIFQACSVLHAMYLRLPYAPEFLVVQNPPSIPTLALVQLFTWTRPTKLIIDWHNLGYSILALKLGEKNRLVAIAKWFEKTFGRQAYAHLFVTRAMRNRLVQDWHLLGHDAVLYDRPPTHFHTSSPAESHNLFTSLPPFDPPVNNFFPNAHRPQSTPFTQVTPVSTAIATSFAAAASFSPEAFPLLRRDRPALVISSTSWTPDEDFNILLTALQIYERRARVLQNAETKERLPKLLMIVTGKGDMRDEIMQKVYDLEREEDWKYVRCRSLWMTAADYPTLLGSADLGVSLHSSSSHLDLPMKVVDMFGCGLPVCALDFSCLNELVMPGVNGAVFKDSDGLAELFERFLKSFPSENSELEQLRGSVRHFVDPMKNPRSQQTSKWGTWDENWDQVVQPLVISDTQYKS